MRHPLLRTEIGLGTGCFAVGQIDPSRSAWFDLRLVSSSKGDLCLVPNFRLSRSCLSLPVRSLSPNRCKPKMPVTWRRAFSQVSPAPSPSAAATTAGTTTAGMALAGTGAAMPIITVPVGAALSVGMAGAGTAGMRLAIATDGGRDPVGTVVVAAAGTAAADGPAAVAGTVADDLVADGPVVAAEAVLAGAVTVAVVATAPRISKSRVRSLLFHGRGFARPFQ